jgi:glycerol-3-phosphate acyltransferase PlsY
VSILNWLLVISGSYLLVVVIIATTMFILIRRKSPEDTWFDTLLVLSALKREIIGWLPFLVWLGYIILCSWRHSAELRAIEHGKARNRKRELAKWQVRQKELSNQKGL